MTTDAETTMTTAETESLIESKGLDPGDFWAITGGDIPDGEDRPLLTSAQVEATCATLLQHPLVRARAEYTLALRALREKQVALAAEARVHAAMTEHAE